MDFESAATTLISLIIFTISESFSMRLLYYPLPRGASKLKILNLLNKSRIFNIDPKIQGHIVHHWKAVRYSKDDSRGLSCGSTLNIHQDLLKSGNLLHKQGFVDSQFCTTVHYTRLTAAIALFNKFFVYFSQQVMYLPCRP